MKPVLGTLSNNISDISDISTTVYNLFTTWFWKAWVRFSTEQWFYNITMLTYPGQNN